MGQALAQRSGGELILTAVVVFAIRRGKRTVSFGRTQTYSPNLAESDILRGTLLAVRAH
jgi:hypothetical protein